MVSLRHKSGKLVSNPGQSLRIFKVAMYSIIWLLLWQNRTKDLRYFFCHGGSVAINCGETLNICHFCISKNEITPMVVFV